MAEEVRIFRDLEELSWNAAKAVAATVADTIRRRGWCSMVLSGGRTPVRVYRLLGSEFRDRVPWAHVHFFWGDERYVGADDPNSNYRMAREALLDQLPSEPSHVHPIPTHFASASAAALDYEETLQRRVGARTPMFDLVLLGLGEDGHTASVFAGSEALEEQSRWAVAVHAPIDPPTRVTLTLPVLRRAAVIYVFVSGQDKARALRETFASADRMTTPAAGIRLCEGTLIWWVDRGAAGNGWSQVQQ